MKRLSDVLPDRRDSFNAIFAALDLSRPPWEVLIEQLADATPIFWQEPVPQVFCAIDATMPALVLASSFEFRRPGNKAIDLFARWQRAPEGARVDISAVRALSHVLSNLGNASICVRTIGQRVKADVYVAPIAEHFVKLLYRANRAISMHPPLLRSLLHGLTITAIHPFLDGNGRGARMYWIRGLHSAGFSPAQIANALHLFYGQDRRAARVYTSCACTGGTSLPFVRRWHEILQAI